MQKKTKQNVNKILHQTQLSNSVMLHFTPFRTFHDHEDFTALTITSETCLEFIRWQGTPCNIYKDERIPKAQGRFFENLKIY